MLLAAYASFTIFSIVELLHPNDRDARFHKFLLFLADSLFFGQHWIFAFSYLSVAINFKLIFSFSSEYVYKKIRNRVVFFRIVLCMILLVIFITVTVFDYDKEFSNGLATNIIICIGDVALVVILTFSI